jgi:hypothetical protein
MTQLMKRHVPVLLTVAVPTVGSRELLLVRDAPRNRLCNATSHYQVYIPVHQLQ